MTKQRLTAALLRALPALTLALAGGAASAAPVYWTDWTGADTDPGTGFAGNGTITTPSTSVNVAYTNAAGVGFYQPSGGNDYWTPRVPVSNSPYTSSQVDNAPDSTDIIALQHAGNQTLTFSQTVVNPVFAFVSLNGNGSLSAPGVTIFLLDDASMSIGANQVVQLSPPTSGRLAADTSGPGDPVAMTSPGMSVI